MFNPNFMLKKVTGKTTIDGIEYDKVDKKAFVHESEFVRTWQRFPEYTGYKRVKSKWVEIKKEG